MRRRRKKNNLLTRIILISIGVHAIALPIAAHYGALDKLKKDFGAAQVVMVTVQPLEEKKQAVKKEKKAPKKSESTAKKGPSSAHHAARTNAKPNPFAPKVVASNTPDDGSGEGPSVDANGTGKAGVLPSSGAPVTSGSPAPTAPVHTTPVASAPVTTPSPKPEAPAVTATPAPVEKKFVQVETISAPDPVIPDDLRSEPLDKTLVVEADVSTAGEPQNVKVAESTGNRELDDLGLDTARHYKFKPATYGDEPVVGHVRFRILFKVE